MRFRNTYMIYGGILVFLVLTLTDPDLKLITNLPFSAPALAVLVNLLKTVFYVASLHLSRKALLDYLDFEELFENAKRTPEGSGKAIIGVGLIYIAVAVVIWAATV